METRSCSGLCECGWQRVDRHGDGIGSPRPGGQRSRCVRSGLRLSPPGAPHAKEEEEEAIPLRVISAAVGDGARRRDADRGSVLGSPVRVLPRRVHVRSAPGSGGHVNVRTLRAADEDRLGLLRARLEVELRRANAQKIARVAACLPQQRPGPVDGSPDKHEPASPARATGSTTSTLWGSLGGCDAYGNG